MIAAIVFVLVFAFLLLGAASVLLDWATGRQADRDCPAPYDWERDGL